MAEAPAREYWNGTGLMMLVGALLLAPLAWLLDMQVSYSLVKWVCEHDRRGALLAVPAVSLALIGLAAWMSWSSLKKLEGEARQTGGRPIDRSHLLAVAGLALSAVFGLLILTSFAPRLLLSPCE